MKPPKRYIAGILLAVLLTTTSSNAQHLERKVNNKRVVAYKPGTPSDRIHTRTALRRGYVWIDGYYKWNRRSRSYVWIEGHQIRQKKGKIWISGKWKRVPGGWTYISGFWA